MVLVRIIRRRHCIVQLLQVMFKGRKRTVADSRLQVEGEAICRTMSSLWSWLGYEARYRTGFLPLLLDSYTRLGDSQSFGKLFRAVAKHSIVTLLCTAWGVRERPLTLPIQLRKVANTVCVSAEFVSTKCLSYWF